MSINTFIELIKHADRNDNSVLLNELFKVNEELFVQCFVKSDENTLKILKKNRLNPYKIRFLDVYI